MAESFFATLECELLDRTRFHDHHQAQREIFEYIEGWYNPQRRHQGLGYQSPMGFEKTYQEAALNPSHNLSPETDQLLFGAEARGVRALRLRLPRFVPRPLALEGPDILESHERVHLGE